MKKGWEIKKLGEVCEFENGDRGVNYPSKAHRTETGLPFINAGHLTSDGLDLDSMDYISRERYNLLGSGKIKKGDILFCLRGSLGKFAKIQEFSEGAIASSLVIVRPKLKVTSDFVMHYFESKICSDMIADFGNGAAQPNLSAGSLKNFEIPLPPLPEQQHIVVILDEVFGAIAKAKANAEQNLKNVKELFESYLQGVFETKGEGWEEKTLGEIATFRNGMNFTKSSKGEKINIVGVKDFQKSFWVPFETLETVTLDGKLNDLDLLKEGDILAVRSNGNPQLIGRTLLASEVVGKVSHSGFTIRIRLNAKNVDPVYLCNFLKITKTRKILVDGGNGVGIKSLNQGSLAALLMPIPSVKQQQTIVQKIDALSSETKKLEAIYQQKINDLEELKKSVLQKAFAGELKEDLKEHFAENA